MRVSSVVGSLLALVASVSLVACGSDDAPGEDEARVVVSGAATVTGADGVAAPVTGTTTLSFGDTIALDEGTAVVELAGGQTYELRATPEPSVLEIGTTPTLVSGDALVSGGFPAQIRHDTTTVSAQGTMKLQSAVPAVVSYAGRARIDGAGSLDEVQGLRRVVLSAAAQPEPLVFDGADPWDRRFLGDAIAFGQRLEALARGYTADLGPGGGRSAGFFEAAIPALADEREFGADLIDSRDVGDTLVGAAIVAQGRRGTFRERWDAVFTFRDAGAAWGIVALDQGVSSAPLLDTVELAVAAPEPASSSATTAPEPSAPTTPSTPSSTPGSPPTTGTTTTTVPTSTPPSTALLDPVLDPVSQILEDLLGVLGL
jgi:hypothetical protein